MYVNLYIYIYIFVKDSTSKGTKCGFYLFCFLDDQILL